MCILSPHSCLVTLALLFLVSPVRRVTDSVSPCPRLSVKTLFWPFSSAGVSHSPAPSEPRPRCSGAPVHRCCLAAQTRLTGGIPAWKTSGCNIRWLCRHWNAPAPKLFSFPLASLPLLEAYPPRQKAVTQMPLNIPSLGLKERPFSESSVEKTKSTSTYIITPDAGSNIGLYLVRMERKQLVRAKVSCRDGFNSPNASTAEKTLYQRI